MTALALQHRLKAAGYDPGELDGKIGQRTLAALDEALAQAALASGDLAGEDEVLLAELERDEKYVRHAYKDSLGFWTIGIGRLIDQRRGGGISRAEALFLKRNDVARGRQELDDAAPWWRDLDDVRQRVVQNMTFNLGVGWIKAFPTTVAAIRRGDWRAAAAGMRGSLWAQQVGARAERLAKMMETGRA